MRCPHQRHVPTEGPSCSYTAWPKSSSAAAHIRSLRTPAARFETKLVWSAAQPKTVRAIKVLLPAFRLFEFWSLSPGFELRRKGLLSCAKQSQLVQVLMHPLLQNKRRQPVLPHCSGHERASTTLDPDDYELFEESYDPDDYEPLDVRFSAHSLSCHDTLSCQGSLASISATGRKETSLQPYAGCISRWTFGRCSSHKGERKVMSWSALTAKPTSICKPAFALCLVGSIKRIASLLVLCLHF